MVQIPLGKNLFLFCFWAVISWLLFILELIHDCAKWSIHGLIHHVWLSIRLNYLIAGHKTNWTEKMSLSKLSNKLFDKSLSIMHFCQCICWFDYYSGSQPFVGWGAPEYKTNKKNLSLMQLFIINMIFWSDQTNLGEDLLSPE